MFNLQPPRHIPTLTRAGSRPGDRRGPLSGVDLPPELLTSSAAHDPFLTLLTANWCTVRGSLGSVPTTSRSQLSETRRVPAASRGRISPSSASRWRTAFWCPHFVPDGNVEAWQPGIVHGSE